MSMKQKYKQLILRFVLSVLFVTGMGASPFSCKKSSPAAATPAAAAAAPSGTSASVNGDCEATTYGEPVTVNAGYATTGTTYLDIPFTPIDTITQLSSITLVMSSTACSNYQNTPVDVTLINDNGSGVPGFENGFSNPLAIPCSALSSTPTPITFSPGYYMAGTLTGGVKYHIIVEVNVHNSGDAVNLSLYSTANSNCEGATGPILKLSSGVWTNVSGSNVGILGIE